MPITQIPSNIVIPKQPKIYTFLQSTAGTGTWYTAISATGIRGILSKSTMTIDGASSSNSAIEMRITIDGVINTIGVVGGNNSSTGLNHNGYTSNTYVASDSIDYFANVTFLNSITVEFRQSTGVTRQLNGTIMYSIE